MRSLLKPITTAITGVLLLSGCAQPSLHSIQTHQNHLLSTAKADRTAHLRWLTNGIYVSHHAVDYTPGNGSITLNSRHAPVGATLAGLLQQKHYSLFFAGSASPPHPGNRQHSGRVLCGCGSANRSGRRILRHHSSE